MAVLDRVTGILRANVNDLLDKAEDPEKMLNQLTRDMAEATQRAKVQVTETIAQENLLKASLAKAQELAAQWQQKAALAVVEGQDDLARECLKLKKDCESNAAALQTQLISQHQTVQTLKAGLQALESKYNEMNLNRGVLIARHKTAEAQKKIQDAVTAATTVDYSSELGRMEDKISLEEARAAASAELSGASLGARLEALSSGEKDAALEAELRDLKAQKSKGAMDG
ncbi:MAG: PspA/IM30 family protein [Candidatus Marsarchaeota archaeon]|nr:PspA/IM30 family protein [Candidatus Marsarchaeota archaeon]